jgi:hypothetical protein
VWGSAFFLSQSLIVGWKKAAVYVALAAVLSAVLVPVALFVRQRRDRRRRSQHPFWVE